VAKRTQHFAPNNVAIYCIGTLQFFYHRVAMCCDMLRVVGSSLIMVKFEPTTPNMLQHGGQTHTTFCAQQCCDMLCRHVAIVWPGLNGETSSRVPAQDASRIFPALGTGYLLSRAWRWLHVTQHLTF